MKQLFFLAILLAGNTLFAQDAVKLIGVTGKNDIPEKIIQSADGSYIVAGIVDNDASVYKLDCHGAILDSLRKDLSIANSFERIYDVAELPNGEFIAVGYAKAIVSPPGNNVNAVLAMRLGTDLFPLAFDTFHIQAYKGAEAHHIQRLSNGEWMLCGIQDGAGFDFADIFCVKFNPITLKTIGAPIIFSYGVDDIRSVDPTADGNLIVSGVGVSGNIFLPEALLNQQPFVRKINPEGQLIWEYVSHYQMKNKYGRVYFDGAQENPATGNIMVSGVKTKGDTLNPLDLHYVLLSPNGDSLTAVSYSLPGSQNINQSIRFGDAPYYGFASVGDSAGPVAGAETVRVFFGLVTEAAGQIVPLGHTTDHSFPASLRSLVAAPNGRVASVSSVANPQGGTVHQDWIVVTPTIEVSITFDDPELIVEVNPPGNHDFQWYKNGVAIPGETGLTYEITEGGQYSVLVTDANACSAEAYFVISDTKSPESEQVRVSPNPFTENLSVISTDAAVIIEMELTDITGKILIPRQVYSPELHLKNLCPGVYLLKLKTEKGMLVKKVVKN